MNAVTAIMIVTVVMLLILLTTSCTMLTHEQQQALALQAKGCYCEGKGCRELKSAAGRAAVATAGGESKSATQVERLK